MDAIASQRTFVTGFGPFQRFEKNPSAWLARNLQRPFEVLEVSFAAVDAFIKRFDARDFDRLVLIGLHGRTSQIRLEAVARNRIGRTPDNTKSVRKGRIDPFRRPRRRGTLWPRSLPSALPEDRAFILSANAGDYLCNYLYWRCLERFPGKAVGFLHVPTASRMPLHIQLHRIESLLDWTESQDSRTERR